ncbi:hypothetical protein BDY21DRAFT_362975 [Lineolata rhizophorae]|uniref:Uncharacterized protein n=1 Tax=Lineolata rhizophorae TaxID=578093 RepID=A0A6A6P4L8_9PEZI|nr:hypothetical protein BDY21DRAFT_362975 [Lineolata rhizophorae]
MLPALCRSLKKKVFGFCTLFMGQRIVLPLKTCCHISNTYLRNITKRYIVVLVLRMTIHPVDPRSSAAKVCQRETSLVLTQESFVSRSNVIVVSRLYQRATSCRKNGYACRYSKDQPEALGRKLKLDA